MSHVQPTGEPVSRSARLDQAIADLLREVPELEAAAVVSFDGLPMASALPGTMDEDRVAAMSAALLSLGERAAQGLGRGELSQVYIEGETGTVFLVSADDEAVLVAVAAPGAKVGMMLYEVRRAAAVVADVLRADRVHVAEPTYEFPVESAVETPFETPAETLAAVPADVPLQSEVAPLVEPVPAGNGATTGSEWGSYSPGGTVLPGTNDPGVWS
jgi:predicted regulator of Ras-like GTPase activity (Roadblock/LC7/MglB family)